MRNFVKLNSGIVNVANIEYIDDTQIEQLHLIVYHKHGVDVVDGFFAIELFWLLKPSALEGKKLMWRKHVWSIHNLFAHPLMQLLAYCRLYKAAMWIHDVTTPKPIGTKLSKQ